MENDDHKAFLEYMAEQDRLAFEEQEFEPDPTEYIDDDYLPL
jgi:hypothetical protein